jgi:hypothetical protein
MVHSARPISHKRVTECWIGHSFNDSRDEITKHLNRYLEKFVQKRVPTEPFLAGLQENRPGYQSRHSLHFLSLKGSVKSVANSDQKSLSGNGFVQKPSGTGLQSSALYLFVAVGSDEDYRELKTPRGQQTLQFQSSHPWHLYIQQQAGCLPYPS